MTHAAATDGPASIDLSDNDAFVDRVPYQWFDELRRADPVHWQPERHGRGFWAVTAHADVVAVSRDWATFSSQTGASALEDLAPDALAARRSMIDTDPPLHTDLRHLVSAPFAVRPVRDYEEMVRSVSRQVLAGALAEDRFDFAERVAAAVPIKVLCRVLGVPEHDEGLLIDLGDQMIANTDPDLASVLLDGGQSEQYRLLPFRSPAAAAMFDYSRRLSQARQRQPRPDLITALVQGTIGGRPLPQHEIDAMFLLLVVAGERDHPAGHRPGRAGAASAPRPDRRPAQRRRPRLAHRGGGTAPLDHPAAPFPPHRHLRHRTRAVKDRRR